MFNSLKYDLLFLSLVIGFCAPLSRLQAASVTLFATCYDGGLLHLGYETDAAFTGTTILTALHGGDLEVIGDTAGYFGAGRDDHALIVQVGAETVLHWSVYDETSLAATLMITPGDAGHCPADNGTGEPDGAFETVTFEVAPGCYTWQFFDNVWHDVRLKDGSLAETCSQEEDGRVFVRLPLVRGSVTDPTRYRVWVVNDD